MTDIHLLKVLLGVAVVGLFISVAPLGSISTAAAMDQSKTAEGLTVHLGVVPAEIVKGSQPHSGQAMHGGIPKGMHEHHLVVAVFEAATGARVADANVSAQVSGIGLAGSTKTLEAMQIAGTTTYGAFFDLPGADLYTIKVTIARPGLQRPVAMTFKYDHRR